MDMETAHVESEQLADKQCHPAVLSFDVSFPHMQKPELNGKLRGVIM